MPSVSVVIPAYNAERFLAAAIESVLAQTFADLEVIVVDDGSTDGTASVVESYGQRVTYIRQANSGVAAARNRGIAASTGAYVGFLDADDTWLPHKLDRQLSALREHPTHHACYSSFLVVDLRLEPLRVQPSPRSGPLLEDLLLIGNVVGCPTVICERALFERAGGFDPELSQCADWDMWIRLGLLTDMLYLDEPLASYRQHADNMSRDIPRYERDAFRVLDKAFEHPELPVTLRSRRNEAYGRMYLVLAGSYYHAARYRDSLRCAARALALHPLQATYLLGFPVRRMSRALGRDTDSRP
jgi:glycosyltransferase involved in cell wall biosynthesis